MDRGSRPVVGSYEARYGLRQAECQDLVTAMLAEFEELQPIVRAKVAVGHRPR